MACCGWGSLPTESLLPFGSSGGRHSVVTRRVNLLICTSPFGGLHNPQPYRRAHSTHHCPSSSLSLLSQCVLAKIAERLEVVQQSFRSPQRMRSLLDALTQQDDKSAKRVAKGLLSLLAPLAI